MWWKIGFHTKKCVHVSFWAWQARHYPIRFKSLSSHVYNSKFVVVVRSVICLKWWTFWGQLQWQQRVEGWVENFIKESPWGGHKTQKQCGHSSKFADIWFNGPTNRFFSLKIYCHCDIKIWFRGFHFTYMNVSTKTSWSSSLSGF